MPCDEVRRVFSGGDKWVPLGRAIRKHLHECGSCRGFRAGIEDRTLVLRSASPNLEPVAARSVFGSITGAAGGDQVRGDESKMRLQR